MPNFAGTDDQPIVIQRKDFSGGINTRKAANEIEVNQVEEISNYDISIPGEVTKIKGITSIEDLSDGPITGLFGFEPSGGSNVLVATHAAKLETWPGSSTFTERKTNFTTGLTTSIIKAEEDGEGDVFLATNGTDNWFRFKQSDYSSPQDLGSTAGTGSDSPPKSAVGLYYRNRLWVVKDNLWYFSDPFPADYATAFDTVSNAFRAPIGKEMAAVGIRDLGIIFFGKEQIWGLNPSVTPDPATDKPEKILEIGCIAGNTVRAVADDILFLAQDGVRGLFRTQQDKLQAGNSFPLSFGLKTQYQSLSWAYISKACAEYWDGKYFLSVPVNSSTHNNQVWVYYPALGSWRIIDGWNVGAWGKMKIAGEERLFYGDSVTGKIYRAFYGSDNDGTAITSTFIGREEDLGAASNYKSGGEIEVVVQTINDAATIGVYASFDGQGYILLGNIDMASGTAPSLPVSLPFTLADNYVLYKKFHIDSYGLWRTIQLKFVDSITTSSDLTWYNYSIRTFVEEYRNE